MGTLLAVNPKSRQGDDAPVGKYVERLGELGSVTLHSLTDSAPIEDAIAVLGDSLERIVIGGGDGTINRCLSGLRNAGVPFGILPLGTANDLARSLELSPKPELAIETILEGQTRSIDLGVANGLLFANAAGIGLGPELTKTLDHDKKARLGVLAYLVSFVEVLGNRKSLVADLDIDGVAHKLRFIQITIANGRSYGGGLTVAEEATIHDGLLHVLCLRPQTVAELLGKFATLRWGVKPASPKVELHTGTAVQLRTRKTQQVTLDGELATTTPITCQCIPDALNVFVPKTAKPASDD